MNGKRVSFAVLTAAIFCFSAFAVDVSFAASASPKGQQKAPLQNNAGAQEDVQGTSSFFELIFERELANAFIASGRRFVVTPQTAFVDRYGSKTSLSSIRSGSIIRVRYLHEKSNDPMTAVNVLVAKEPR